MNLVASSPDGGNAKHLEKYERSHGGGHMIVAGIARPLAIEVSHGRTDALRWDGLMSAAAGRMLGVDQHKRRAVFARFAAAGGARRARAHAAHGDHSDADEL
eukprot:4034709-Prymnesium_polylepis.1